MLTLDKSLDRVTAGPGHFLVGFRLATKLASRPDFRGARALLTERDVRAGVEGVQFRSSRVFTGGPPRVKQRKLEGDPRAPQQDGKGMTASGQVLGLDGHPAFVRVVKSTPPNSAEVGTLPGLPRPPCSTTIGAFRCSNRGAAVANCFVSAAAKRRRCGFEPRSSSAVAGLIIYRGAVGISQGSAWMERGASLPLSPCGVRME